ncbi:hypothetical protein BE11_35600 [Sorangium cellulosum]|nr:hypothetical protein BE11_35600 [Sorangium cellulosum]
MARLLRGGARGLVVATTRPQGYGGELEDLGLALQTRHLVPLSKERALVYAEKLAEARFAEPPERRKRVLERLRLAGEEEATARLMRSPLQVTIMATLVDRVGRAPRERWNLFRDYYRVIYEREMERTVEGPASAGVGVALNDTAELLRSHRAYIDRIHANVALLLQVESEHSGGTAALMTAGRLEQVIDAVLAEDEIEPQARRELTGRIVQAARDRLVFLVEPQPGRFGFEIRSLQEFMAAWALASKGEVLLEKRIARLAKAASFRNVVLFLVSKCFTELSDLRDAFTERICPQLNDDPEDEVARATLAGSMLALDILEEGSALEQPKYARRLMEIAARLLELPPGPEHVWLAHIQATSTVDTLRGALHLHLTGGSLPARLAAWITIAAAIALQEDWADLLANESWPASADERRAILLAVVQWLGSIKPWLQQRIREAPGDFPPSFLESVRSDNDPIIGWDTLAKISGIALDYSLGSAQQIEADGVRRIAELYSAQPHRHELVILLGQMAVLEDAIASVIDPALLQPERFTAPDARTAAVLLLLVQGQLVQGDPEVTAREIAEHWSDEVFPAYRLADFLGSLLLDRDTLDQVLLALYRHALPRSWSLAGELIALLRDRLRQRASGLDDPALWDHLRLPLPLPLVFPVSGAEPAGPMYLRRINVERVRSITSIQWELPRSERGPGWHVILGENGAGKSSFLRAAALSLLGPDASGALRQPWSEWVRRDATSARVEARLSYEVTSHGPHAHPPGLHPAAGQDGSDIRSDLSLDLILELAQAGTETKIVEQTEAARALVRRAAGAFSAAYGPFRRFSDGDPAYEKMFVDQPRVARHISLFDSRIALTESLAWLRELRFKQLDNKPEGALLEPFKKFASDAGPPFFLPHGAHLADVSSDGVTFVDGNGFDIPVEDLSDGYRAVLSLTFDLLRHMAAVFGHERVFDPEDPTVVLPGGVVLIDEIDAHLHPSWQRQKGGRRSWPASSRPTPRRRSCRSAGTAA